jgi:hypothetical protein
VKRELIGNVSELRLNHPHVVWGGGAAQRRPNVLFMLADDLGYGDLSCYGRPDYQIIRRSHRG